MSEPFQIVTNVFFGEMEEEKKADAIERQKKVNAYMAIIAKKWNDNAKKLKQKK